MRIEKGNNFLITIVGKCNYKQDILQLFDFGYSKEAVVKKYKKDNKLKINEARRIVEETLLERSKKDV